MTGNGFFGWVAAAFGDGSVGNGIPSQARTEQHRAGVDVTTATSAARDDIWRSLSPCRTCKAEVAVLAEHCPKCGAPNEWEHPLISALKVEAKSLELKRPYKLRFEKTKVHGETPRAVSISLKLVAWAVFFVCFFMGLLYAFTWAMLWWFLAGGAIPALLERLCATSETFCADLRAQTWSSSSDKLWQPIRVKLQLPKT